MPRKQVRRQGFETRQKAVDALHELQQTVKTGGYVDLTRQTLGEYLDGWLARLKLTRSVRANTHDEWESHVRNHLKPHLGSIRLQQLAPAQIQAFYDQLHATGHQRTGEGLSPKSVWNIHMCLRKALTDATKAKLIPSNPASALMRRPDPERDVDFWTSEQLAGFLAWVDANRDQQDQAFYRLAAETGMRRGELLGLRWLDVDLEGGQLTVVQQLARHRETSLPKTQRGRRSISLGPDLVEHLKAWQEAQAFQRRAWADAYEDLGLVFTRENGTSHDPRVVSHRFGDLEATAGVKRIRFHDLRHTSAVIGLRELGEWPDETSKRLGHASTAFTLDTYGHLLPARGRTVAAAFDRLLADRQEQAETAAK